MSLMIARCVEALAENLKPSIGGDPTQGQPLNKMAIAMIEAMREPTQEMIEAGVCVLWDSGAHEPIDGVDQLLIESIFVAMIDEIRK